LFLALRLECNVALDGHRNATPRGGDDNPLILSSLYIKYGNVNAVKYFRHLWQKRTQDEY